MARRVVLALIVLGGLLALVFGGLDAFGLYLFFAGLAGALAYAAAVGGDWVRDVSRSRFDRDDR